MRPPIGLGRRPGDVRRISRSTGVHIIASTGFHRDGHYPAGRDGQEHPLRALTVEQKAALMLRDVAVGMPARDPGPAAPTPSGRRSPAARRDAQGRHRVLGDHARRTRHPRGDRAGACRDRRPRDGPPGVLHRGPRGAGPAAVPRCLRARGAARPCGPLPRRRAAPGADGAGARTWATTGWPVRRCAATRSCWTSPSGSSPAAASACCWAATWPAPAGTSPTEGCRGSPISGDRYLPRLRARIGEEALSRLLVEAPARLLARRWRGLNRALRRHRRAPTARIDGGGAARGGAQLTRRSSAGSRRSRCCPHRTSTSRCP